MWSTIGQDHVLRQLDASLRTGRLSHAYLLTGPPHVGKMTLAMDLAAAVNCPVANGSQGSFLAADTDVERGPCRQCETCARIQRGVFADLKVVSVGDDPKVSTRISIEQVREAESFLSVTPVEGSWKVVIFDGAETLSAGQSEPANALLKTLEEPPPNVLLMLLTTDAESMLPTIRSRCRTLPLRPMPGADLADYLSSHCHTPLDEALRLARLARGCPGWAISAQSAPENLDEYRMQLEQIIEVASSPLDERFGYANGLAGAFSGNREEVRQTLYLWQRWWHDVLLAKAGVLGHLQNPERRAELADCAAGCTTGDIVQFLRSVQQTLVALDANVNPRLALECMMLAMPA